MSKTDRESSGKWWRYGIAPASLEELSAEERKRAKSLNHWFLLWILVVFGGVVGPRPLLANVEVAYAWRVLLALMGVASTLFLIRAYRVFYRNTKDEWIRKVYQDSLAAGFAAAFFLGVCSVVLEPIFDLSGKTGPLIWAGMLLAYLVSHVLLIQKHSHA